VLPDAALFKAAADAFVLHAGRLDRAARAWQPTASDAFTAIVVMVPTMSEYFGQWKVSRFVLGERARGDAFNVVSRLSDIGDILGGLRERKLPHRKMLIATGILVTRVLVVMVGTTVQTMQKVGWLAVKPIAGLELPTWRGSGSVSIRPGRASSRRRWRRRSSSSAATSPPREYERVAAPVCSPPSI
jgi:hypothetical protein